MGRAADIDDLERMLNDGDGDDVLNARAIEIFERLRDELKRFKYSPSVSEKDRLKAEVEDFEDTLKQIEARRHEHALDRFKEYLKNQPD